MEGHEFEYFCADLLRKKGFIAVEVTKVSGDYGIDILAKVCTPFIEDKSKMD
ncbi:MAG: restriction endonuclease [Lachnospiraceae bacterium]|nr:restriction endonuclease [Lachnospiraceae bacterium]